MHAKGTEMLPLGTCFFILSSLKNNTGISTSSKQMFLWRIQKNKVLDHSGILLFSLPGSASRTLVESRG